MLQKKWPELCMAKRKSHDRIRSKKALRQKLQNYWQIWPLSPIISAKHEAVISAQSQQQQSRSCRYGRSTRSKRDYINGIKDKTIKGLLVFGEDIPHVRSGQF